MKAGCKILSGDSGMDRPKMLSAWAVITLFLLVLVLCESVEPSPVDAKEEGIRDESELQRCIPGGVINWATQKAALEYFGILQSGVKTNQTQVV